MDPGFRRENGSRSCQFFISIWILAQPLRFSALRLLDGSVFSQIT